MLCEKMQVVRQPYSVESTNTFNEIINHLQVRYSRASQVVRYLEQPMLLSNDSESPPVLKQSKLIVSLQNAISVFNGNTIKYHIRIHNGNNAMQMTNLQYLALLLQKTEPLFVDKSSDAGKRLSAIVIPPMCNEYPFEGSANLVNAFYKETTRFLRLLAKEYTGVIYGVVNDGELNVVRPIANKDSNKTHSYFPLIPINDFSYSQLSDNIKCAEDDNELFELLRLRKDRRFRNANDDNPVKALRDFILEASILKTRDDLDMTEISFDEFSRAIEVYSSESKISVLQFAVFSYLFGALFSAINGELNTKVSEALIFSYDISSGLLQLLQNALYHSETKQGLFSFCLQQCLNDEQHNEFLNAIEQEYYGLSAVFTDENSHPAYLEVFVSDLNFKETMIENFVAKIKDEATRAENVGVIEAFNGLISESGNISIRNFFDEYDDGDPQSQWERFRLNSSDHMGLKEFAVIAKKCSASIKVKSCLSFLSNDKRYKFQKAYNGINNGEEPNVSIRDKAYTNQLMIPGTQFSLLIPMIPYNENKNVTGLQQIKIPNIIETHASLAQYLDFGVVKINEVFDAIIKEISKMAILNALQKKDVREVWELVIKEIIDVNVDLSKEVIYIDLSENLFGKYLSNGDNVEIFIRSTINEVLFSKRRKPSEKTYFALTNASDRFVRTLDSVLTVELKSNRDMNDNMQLFVHEKGSQRSTTLLGKNLKEAYNCAYLLSLQDGFGLLDISCDKTAISGQIDKEVCPFDALIPYNIDSTMTIFDHKIKLIAEKPIDEAEGFGYKIAENHMRLGNKVHINGFYEMAILFYRTYIANRFAIELLRIIRTNSPDIHLDTDSLLFYGYSSYSKAILFSTSEILRAYRNTHELAVDNIHYAIYQFNLQTETTKENVQLYRAFDDDEDIVLKDYKIVQIVPISSTLTTFGKMFDVLKNNIKKDNIKKDNNKEITDTQLVENHTMFWVGATANTYNVESKYHGGFDSIKRVIDISEIQQITANTYYYIRSKIDWHDPRLCKLCYPSDFNEELPLMETDITSTIPTQQIRKKRINACQSIKWDERILHLINSDCVYYGHFVRGKNHFQYYIDTQRLFRSAKKDIIEWLSEERKKHLNEIELENPCLHVIFSPEHNTNVEFAQCVNNYYFNGIAEVISVNIEKEYRSNFECENSGLVHTIKQLYNREQIDHYPVKFYFADDTIISGTAFYRSRDLLRTLLPDDLTESFVFDKCFLLVERLSGKSKKSYVANMDNDFLSFVHIGISSLRTNGDSCICCKLRDDARTLFKRSSTRELTKYWARKNNNYRCKGFGESISVKGKKEDAIRLAVAHIANEWVSNMECNQELECIISLLTAIFYGEGKEPGEQLTFADNTTLELVEYLETLIYSNRKNVLSAFEVAKICLKVLTRPFFTFEYKFKKAMLQFMIIFAEYYIADIAERQEMLESNDSRLIMIIEIADKFIANLNNETDKLKFLYDYILEPLSDMKSTYIIRKKTIKRIAKFVDKVENPICTSPCDGQKSVGDGEQPERELDCEGEHNIVSCFWRRYAAFVHSAVMLSGDETRTAWLECLLLSGEEYSVLGELGNKEFSPKLLFESTGGEGLNDENKEAYKHFCKEIFLLNTRIIYDELQKKSDTEKSSQTDTIGNKCFHDFRTIDNLGIELSNDYNFEAETSLYGLLKKYATNNDELDINAKYEELLECIARFITTKHDLHDVNVSLLTYSHHGTKESKSEFNKMGSFDWIASGGKQVFSSTDKCDVKEKSSREAGIKLTKYGYTLLNEDNHEDKEGCILYFDNPKETVEINDEDHFGRSIKKIAHVFLYVEYKKRDNYADITRHMIMRDLLTFRHKMLTILECDFAGDIFSKYAHSHNDKNILSHEKAVAHATTSDDELEFKILAGIERFENSKESDAIQKQLWLIFKRYVNVQIAKLFSRNFLDIDKYEEERARGEVPELYVQSETKEKAKLKFMAGQLTELNDLYNVNLENRDIPDNRMVMIDKIVDLVGFDVIKCAKIADGKDNIEKKSSSHYNLEYFKCCFFDIILTALKWNSWESNFLDRVNEYMDDGTGVDMRLKLYVSRESNPNADGNDYLVFISKVRRQEAPKGMPIVCRSNKEKLNNSIRMHMKDPNDFSEGRMSLLVINGFIEGLVSEPCIFQYNELTLPPEDKDSFCFVSKLPILKKEGTKNE